MIETTIAETHLLLRLGVLYLHVPTIPMINPTIGIKKANNNAQFAVLLDSGMGLFWTEGFAVVAVCAEFTGHPHPIQTTASSLISFPHF